MIYKQEIYTNAAGQAIFARVPYQHAGPTLFHVDLVFQMEHAGQQLTVQMQEQIPALSVLEAFDLLPVVIDQARAKAQAGVREQLAAAQKPGIFVPGAAPGLNGHALRRPRLAE